MTRFAALAAITIGIAIFVSVAAYSGLDDAMTAIRAAGWASAFVVADRGVAVATAGIGWMLLFPPGKRPSVGVSVLLRFIREGINQLLPVGQVGGDLIGARLATFWRIDGALAGAVTIADVAVQVATQIAFALLGVVILLVIEGDSQIARYALAGLAISAVGVGGFFAVQGRVGFRIVAGLLARVTGRKVDADGLVERLWAQLGSIYASPWRIAASASVHFGGWIFGVLEVYVALNVMGYPIGFAEAVVIESLGQAVRGAAFAVPGGLGVQEGGFVALCAIFGVPPGAGLALSLLKRVPDLVLGIPFLAIWQVLEGRRALTRGDALAGPGLSTAGASGGGR